ncbi:MAG: LysR family transcriptional regulator [Polyangiales bacterium]
MSNAEPAWELYGTLLAVMEGGSLSAASRALGLAQPTVRRRIESLEAALGTPLFTRATNGLVPTDAALAARPHIEAMATAARAVARTASGPAGAERGTVRVTASEVIGAEVLPPILAALARDAPALRVELALTNRSEDLLRREADVAVRMIAPTQTALVARRVGAVPIGLFASADYLTAHGAPARLDDLAAHRLVGPDRDRAALDALASAGITVPARDFALRTDSDLAQLAAVRAGVGIGVAQVPLAARDPRLVRVLPRLTVPLDMWVVMHEDLRALRRVRRVFDHLVAGLGAYLGRHGRRPGGAA